ncbi:dephospho-CoA kinase [Enterococcus villorum]|uniref:Dephospho-CoA kinase n=1 Tax=Enterococcus villorum TaxID=112904 RepID=A0A1V8YG13_9ENTE|nr:dephospho-CoA kinase [Enterococcus villorum]OQO71540.1 dephospho-CoA kinase [Enterococcus villorum]OQO73652.1 dephospho-CoA kinase [Enterococcus villorum]
MSKLPKTKNQKVGYVLGLTGGIATGKSTAAAVFLKHGIPVIDGDIIAREVVEPNTQGLRSLVQEFGEVILKKDGTLDRGALAKIIFHSDRRRKKLDKLLDPFIRHAIKEQIREKKANYPLVVVDIPLLFEGHYEEEVDAVAVVYLPEDLQVQRLMKRNQLSYEDATQRIQSQFSIEEKKERADIIFDNRRSKEELTQQIENWLADFRL